MSSALDLRDNEKLERLKELLRGLGSVAVAYSNGVDSTFLLKVAHDVLGEGCVAVTAVSGALPRREERESADFCRENGIRQIFFPSGELELEAYARNGADRCYHCKHNLFSGILRIAEEEGLAAVAEGSNLDDLGDYRPGLRALGELGVRSPLREAGLTKAEIRALSRALGLPTWDKPSFACLASRLPYGERITAEKLSRVERGERFLAELGLRQYRVRLHGEVARIEVEPEDIPRLAEPETRARLVAAFRAIGFAYAALDLQGYRTGSLNETLKEGGGSGDT